MSEYGFNSEQEYEEYAHASFIVIILYFVVMY